MTTDLFEVIEKRRSERHFKPDPVSGDAIKRILECGLRAPTAGNIQPWQFIVVKRPELKEDLARAAFGQRFVSDAPVVIVVAADPQRSARTYGTRGEMCIRDRRIPRPRTGSYSGPAKQTFEQVARTLRAFPCGSMVTCCLPTIRSRHTN